VYPYPPDYYYWRWYGSNWWPYDDYWD
jgi:hypothetical protein